MTACPCCGRDQEATRPKVGLTRRLADTLAVIEDYHSKHGFSPSYEEMMHSLGLASKAGVFRLVNELEERGHISRLPHQSRSIVLRGAA